MINLHLPRCTLPLVRVLDLPRNKEAKVNHCSLLVAVDFPRLQLHATSEYICFSCKGEIPYASRILEFQDRTCYHRCLKFENPNLKSGVSGIC